jgi:hypothetical protein
MNAVHAEPGNGKVLNSKNTHLQISQKDFIRKCRYAPLNYPGMTEEKILTLHPQGKQGVNILKRRYDAIKDYIVETVKKHGEISFDELSDLAEEQLTATFDGKVLWYLVTVKLDLEARGIIERVPRTSPHKLRMKG